MKRIVSSRCVALTGLIIGLALLPLPSDQACAQTSLAVRIAEPLTLIPAAGMEGQVHFGCYNSNFVETQGGGGLGIETDDGLYEFETPLDQTEFAYWRVFVDSEPAWLDFPWEPNPTLYKWCGTTSIVWEVDIQ